MLILMFIMVMALKKPFITLIESLLSQFINLIKKKISFRELAILILMAVERANTTHSIYLLKQDALIVSLKRFLVIFFPKCYNYIDQKPYSYSVEQIL